MTPLLLVPCLGSGEANSREQEGSIARADSRPHLAAIAVPTLAAV